MLNFQQYLEVSSTVAKEIAAYNGDLPFEHIFKRQSAFIPKSTMNNQSWLPETYSKYRVIVPLKVDPVAFSIKQKLIKLGYWPSKEDNGSKVVSSDFKREVKTGKFLGNPKNGFTEEEIRWWTHNETGNAGEALLSAYANDKYAVVISRHPIDVVRMSDHEGITSCHSQRGSYFQCAVADSKGQGGVAYLVKKADLKDVNLDDPEIFEDRDRRVDGIKPISRIRLRRFVNKKDGTDLAIPELRVYGDKSHSAFKDQVRDWAKDSQGITERLRLKDYKLMGGSYQDTNGSELFNDFFGDDEDSGEAEYGGEDNNFTNRADQWEEEIDDFRKTYSSRVKYSGLYASVELEDGNGPPYISMTTNLYYRFPKSDFIKPPPIEASPKWQYFHTIKKAFNEGDLRYLPGEFDDIESDGDDYVFRFDIPNESDVDGPDSVKEMWEHLIDLERTEYPGAATKIRDKLTELGYMRPHRTQEIGQEMPEFQHFVFQTGKKGEMQAEMPNFVKVGNFRGRYFTGISDSEAVTQMVKDWRGNIDLSKSVGFSNFYNLLSARLKQLAGMSTKFDPRQRFFPGMEEKIDNTWLEKMITPVLTMKKDYEENVYMKLGFVLHGVHNREQVKATEKYIKWLDDNMDHMIQEAGHIFDTVVKPNYAMPSRQETIDEPYR